MGSVDDIFADLTDVFDELEDELRTLRDGILITTHENEKRFEEIESKVSRLVWLLMQMDKKEREEKDAN